MKVSAFVLAFWGKGREACEGSSILNMDRIEENFHRCYAHRTWNGIRLRILECKSILSGYTHFLTLTFVQLRNSVPAQGFVYLAHRMRIKSE